ncbi:MAG: hypothetical protein BWK79_09925 [Beggiatoa sp. IS2]|nr:MAG: hypothetical protein BWK79_09925 [Beggiatoa sp. IS2]
MKINLLLGLGFVFLVNSVFAHEPSGQESAQPPMDKWAPQPPPPPLEMDPNFKKTVEDYMKSWKEGNFKIMYHHEDWEGGATIAQDKYAETFDADFKIHEWEITRTLPIEDRKDAYKVLVLIKHNPSKQVAAFVPPGMTVRSTLRQWWQKKDDKFVHLFNVERAELAKLGMPPEVKDALATPSTAEHAH